MTILSINTGYILFNELTKKKKKNYNYNLKYTHY